MPNTSPDKPPEKSPMKRHRSPEKSPKKRPALNSEKFELLKMVVCKHTAFETNEIIKKFENIQKILRRNLKKCQ